MSCASEAEDKSKINKPIIDPLIAEDYREPPYKMGFLNTQMEIEIPSQFDEARRFSDSRAAVNVKGFWGFINPGGEMIVPPQYLGAWSFSSGLAKVQSAQNRKLGYINPKGDTLIPFIYDQAQSATFGWAPVQKGQYWGLLNRKNETVLPFEFYGIKLLSERYVALQLTEKWNIFDRKEEKTIAENLMAVYSLTDSVFRIKDSQGKYRYIDLSGRPLFEKGAQLAYDPADGVFVRCLEKGICQLFNRQGQTLSDRYKRIRPLGMGRFAFYSEGKWGLMDELGAFILPAQFHQVYSFSEGYAPFQKDDLWGFIDRKGSVVAPNIFGLAWPFENGWARVLSRSGMAFLDKNMNPHSIPRDLSEVRSFSENLAAFKRMKE